MACYRPKTNATTEEAAYLAEAQARLREQNAQLHRDYVARKRAEREALRNARHQAKEEAKALAKQKREAFQRLRACVREQEQAEMEELKRQRAALRDADRALRGGKGVSMRFTLEQSERLEALARRHGLSQSEIIRRLIDAAYSTLEGPTHV